MKYEYYHLVGLRPIHLQSILYFIDSFINLSHPKHCVHHSIKEN